MINITDLQCCTKLTVVGLKPLYIFLSCLYLSINSLKHATENDTNNEKKKKTKKKTTTTTKKKHEQLQS